MTKAAPADAALLVDLMLAVPGGGAALADRLVRGVDWERLLELAVAHAVAETVHQSLTANGLGDRPPPAVREALRDAFEGATARNALLLAEAARVQRALEGEGIRSALLKGAALVAAHYAAVGARHMADADLLVDAERLPRAEVVVRALGATELAPAPIARVEGARLPGWEKHAPALRLPSGVLLELHRRYGLDPATEAATAGILERSRLVQWGDGRLRVAAPADLLGTACHHVHVEHRTDRRYRPRHLADCAVLLAAGASHEDAAALPGAAGAVRRSVQAVARGSDEDAIGSSGRDLATRFAELRGSARGGSVTAALRQLLLPDLDYLAWRYGVARRSPLLPLLYLWRPLRGAWRVVTGR